MGRSVRLVAVSDEYDNTLGLVIKGQPNYDGMMADRDGLLVAHDIIEHQNGIKHIGEIWDELEALGGIYHTRGRHGDMMSKYGQNHSVASNIASDVTRMFSDFLANPYFGPNGLKAGSKPCDYDDNFNEVIEIARRDIPRKNTDMGNGSEGEDANGWNANLHVLFEQYLTLALYRMRCGFRKAAKKYGMGYKSHGFMYNIKEAVNEIIKEIEYEGQEFVLTYDQSGATCKQVWS